MHEVPGQLQDLFGVVPLGHFWKRKYAHEQPCASAPGESSSSWCESCVFPRQSESDRSYAPPDLGFPICKMRGVTGSHCTTLPWKPKEVMLAQSVLGEGWLFHPSLQAECVIFYKSVSG